MAEKMHYEVRGSMALADLGAFGDGGRLIDYDIARRSFEARQRLAARQEGVGTYAAASAVRGAGAGANWPASAMPRQARRFPTVQDVLEAEYSPRRSPLAFLREGLAGAVGAVARLPFWYELRHGSAAGKDDGRVGFREASLTGLLAVSISVTVFFLFGA